MHRSDGMLKQKDDDRRTSSLITKCPSSNPKGGFKTIPFILGKNQLDC